MKGECTSRVQGIQPKSIKKEGESSVIMEGEMYRDVHGELPKSIERKVIPVK